MFTDRTKKTNPKTTPCFRCGKGRLKIVPGVTPQCKKCVKELKELQPRRDGMLRGTPEESGNFPSPQTVIDVSKIR